MQSNWDQSDRIALIIVFSKWLESMVSDEGNKKQTQNALTGALTLTAYHPG